MALRHFQLKTPEPCTQDWQKMRGDARMGHCDLCAKSVHNLAAMTPKEVERLAVRAAMGESVCARITRRVSDDALVTASSTRPSATAGVILSTAMLCGASAAAQESKAPPAGTAVLTGRLLPPDGKQPLLARGIRLRSEAGVDIVAVVQTDGSFSVSALPGTYDIIAKNNFWQGVTVRSAVLHEGYQSLGDVAPRPLSPEEYTTGGAMVAVIGHGHWLRHPVAYVRYVGRRVRAKFQSE
jgi:hypothetical protein